MTIVQFTRHNQFTCRWHIMNRKKNVPAQLLFSVYDHFYLRPWNSLCSVWRWVHFLSSSTQVHPAKTGCVLLYFPCQFGKKLFSMQDKLVNNKHTFSQQNFSATTTPINKRCEMLINLWIHPVVCWYCFLDVGVDHCLILLLKWHISDPHLARYAVGMVRKM